MQETAQDIQAELVLSSEGYVYLDDSSQAIETVSYRIIEKLRPLFQKDHYLGLLQLGILEFEDPLSLSFLFWQSFVRKFISQVCKLTQNPEDRALPSIPVPGISELEEVIDKALCINGAEYLSAEVLCFIWKNLNTRAFCKTIKKNEVIIFFAKNSKKSKIHNNKKSS